MTLFSSASSFPFTLSASASSNSSLPVSTSMSSFFSATSLPPSLSPSSNSSLNQTGCSFDDAALRLPLAVLYSLFFLFGLVGNLFALWVFLFLHSSRNSVRVFLINCAVADLVLLACLPFRVFYHVNGNKWELGSVACKVVGNLFYMNMYISITLLGLISLDRYLRLKGKGKARRGMMMILWGRSRPWSWVACGALWGLSLMALVPMIATAEDKEFNGKCFQYKQRSSKAKGKAYFNAMLVLLFWLVFVMLVVSYAKIASQLLRVSRDKPDLPNAQRYQRTAKKSFFVLFLFTVCFAPYHAFRPVYILSQLSETASCDYLQLVDRTNEVMLLFSAFNSCLDPVMYFLLSGSVRKTALQALGHRLGHRLLFLNDATSNSSTTEFRRPSAPMAFPNAELNTPSVTPRTSICIINSTLRHTGLTTLPTTGQQ
ncbi:putative G-protein coupled receptor 34a [Epinephelus lanceolatus]|uniref:probable G-protein coupled receptor 34 isoform X1 n=2 Tax=Epinephelus lanceolatus TaxID=310571 RepID=UPI001444DA74|nr:probable G-protein coupled receptor 34 isoform X1 [Epinephelus lanceolatus]XP_033472170.1 probable G-protein coupled receptor 34 isoform X1 [Epinephelus lanceolatus]